MSLRSDGDLKDYMSIVNVTETGGNLLRPRTNMLVLKFYFISIIIYIVSKESVMIILQKRRTNYKVSARYTLFVYLFYIVSENAILK